MDKIDKLLSAPHSGILVRDVSTLQDVIEKERSAIIMCGGLLGECMVLQEVIDYIVSDSIGNFGKQPWYKFKMKHKFTIAYKALRDNIKLSRAHTTSSQDRIDDVSDRFYDGLRGDLYLARNGTINELNRIKVNYADCVADMLIVDILLQFLKLRYKSIISYMETVYPAYYDSWYMHLVTMCIKHGSKQPTLSMTSI